MADIRLNISVTVLTMSTFVDAALILDVLGEVSGQGLLRVGYILG